MMENAWVLTAVGAAMAVIGALIARSGRKKRSRCTASATAIIVDVERENETDSDGEKTHNYRPVLEFTAGGQTIRRRGDISSSRKRAFRIGDAKPIVYNPEKPEEFLIAGSSSGVGAGVLLAVIGVVLIIVSVWANNP